MEYQEILEIVWYNRMVFSSRKYQQILTSKNVQETEFFRPRITTMFRDGEWYTLNKNLINEYSTIENEQKPPDPGYYVYSIQVIARLNRL